MRPPVDRYEKYHKYNGKNYFPYYLIFDLQLLFIHVSYVQVSVLTVTLNIETWAWVMILLR